MVILTVPAQAMAVEEDAVIVTEVKEEEDQLLDTTLQISLLQEVEVQEDQVVLHTACREEQEEEPLAKPDGLMVSELLEVEVVLRHLEVPVDMVVMVPVLQDHNIQEELVEELPMPLEVEVVGMEVEVEVIRKVTG